MSDKAVLILHADALFNVEAYVQEHFPVGQFPDVGTYANGMFPDFYQAWERLKAEDIHVAAAIVELATEDPRNVPMVIGSYGGEDLPRFISDPFALLTWLQEQAVPGRIAHNSADHFDELERRALEAGATDYLHKDTPVERKNAVLAKYLA